MRIHKVINNNFVIVKDLYEMIVMGMGIGFKKKPGDQVDETMIVKTFYMTNTEFNLELYKLLNEVSYETVEIAENLIASYVEQTGKSLNDSIHLSLVDHLHSAILRHQEEITMFNAFLYDIKRFYPDEFKYGKQGIQLLNHAYQIKLPEDEAGFIALHLVTAGLNDEDSNAYKITELIKEITSIVSRFFRVEFDSTTIYYNRFINHLKYFAQRTLSEILQPGTGDNPELFQTMTKNYPEVYKCVSAISEFVLKEYGKKIEEEEQIYLIIHISMVINKSSSKKEGYTNE